MEKLHYLWICKEICTYIFPPFLIKKISFKLYGFVVLSLVNLLTVTGPPVGPFAIARLKQLYPILKLI